MKNNVIPISRLVSGMVGRIDSILPELFRYVETLEEKSLLRRLIQDRSNIERFILEPVLIDTDLPSFSVDDIAFYYVGDRVVGHICGCLKKDNFGPKVPGKYIYQCYEVCMPEELDLDRLKVVYLEERLGFHLEKTKAGRR